ncbi:MAG: class I SAM-dependent methyltransferase, partial [Planctomycetes bacterium]|nr:class I SAM-dependent methyltransferase [Planctomycetota bacterium]
MDARNRGSRSTSDITTSWSTLQGLRRQVRERFPDCWSLPVRKKHWDVIFDEVADGQRVLDVGGDRKALDALKARLPGLTYKSMNVDRAQPHDYYSLDDVHEKFQAIFLFEVIEHLAFEEGVSLIQKLHGLLEPGGKLLLTTPNVCHPHRFFDPTHKTAYRHDDLGALLMASGFEVTRVFRLYNASFFPRLFRLYVGVWLHRYLS